MTDRRDLRPHGRPPNRFEAALRDRKMTAAFYAELARQTRALREASERDRAAIQRRPA